MPVEVMTCVNCVGMDYDVEEGTIPRDCIEYDFAEDALDFEVSFWRYFNLFRYLPNSTQLTSFYVLIYVVLTIEMV